MEPLWPLIVGIWGIVEGSWRVKGFKEVWFRVQASVVATRRVASSPLFFIWVFLDGSDV